MPDLNFDNPKVRTEMVDIARFCLEEIKVDGFRFDAAKHVYPDDRAADSHAFWIWYREELTKIKPDVYLIGEVYSVKREEVAPYTKGLPSLFNFEIGRDIIRVINAGKDSTHLAETYQEQYDYFHNVSSDFLDSPILTNHDQNRILSELGGDVSKGKVAASILLTLPGAPYIYYGEELGMLGRKPDEFIREPFPWRDAYTTSWVEPRYNTDSAIVSMADQSRDQQSILNHYKKLIAYRNSSAALTHGNLIPVKGLPREVVGFIRKFGNKEILVLHNISDVEVTISLNDQLSAFGEVAFKTNETIQKNDGSLLLPSYSTAVMSK
jgi:glycosidase